MIFQGPLFIWGSSFFFFVGFWSLPPLVFVTFAITLICGCKYKLRLFKNVQLRNPYKVIYTVIKFSMRSSQNDIENEALQSKLDIGKVEFGGPFQSDKVDAVKHFLAIGSILLTLGPTFAIEIAASEQPPNSGYTFLLSAVTPLVVSVLIPAYTCVRPYIKSRTPGPLLCIVLGMVLFLVSIEYCLVIDTLGHVQTRSSACFLTHDFDLPGLPHRFYPSECQDEESVSEYTEPNGTVTVSPPCFVPLDIPLKALFVPYILNGLAYMLFYVGTYKFILTETPATMKGLALGVFFVIKGSFQLVALLLLYVPFTAWGWSSMHYFPSCGFVYWLINATIALVGILAFVWKARQYRKCYRAAQTINNP